jgi:hypothetical protein
MMTRNEAMNWLAKARRAARHAAALNDKILLMETEARRYAEYLESQDYLTNFAVHERSRQAWLSDRRCESRADMANLGKQLVLAAPYIDAATTIEDRCDILNVNRAHRTFSGRSPGLLVLILHLDIEDSALTVGSQFKNGPLFRCLIAHIGTWLAKHPGDEARDAEPLGSLFHCDGPYFGIPDWYREDDGTVTYDPSMRLMHSTRTPAVLGSKLILPAGTLLH